MLKESGSHSGITKLVTSVSLMRLYLRTRHDMLAGVLQAVCMSNRALHNKYIHVTIKHLVDEKPSIRQTEKHKHNRQF